MRASASGGTPPDGRTALDYAMLVASGLCCLVAAWLFAVLVLVVPDRAPASLVPWALVAVALVLLAGAGTWRSMRAGGSTAATVLTAIVGAAAVAGGAWLIGPSLAGGVEFEGYVLVVGAVAIAQGSLMLASILVRRHPR
jgi:hypothetical protein